jgi:hypothetical protein
MVEPPRRDNTVVFLLSKVAMVNRKADSTASLPRVVKVDTGSRSSKVDMASSPKVDMGNRHNRAAMDSSSRSKGVMASSSSSRKAATEDLLRLANRVRVAILLSKVEDTELLLHHGIERVAFHGLLRS